jgi:hypothetical protein
VAHWTRCAGGCGDRAAIFEDEERFAAADPAVTDAGPHRQDSGDYRVSTLLRLTPERSRVLAILRFGTGFPPPTTAWGWTATPPTSLR